MPALTARAQVGFAPFECALNGAKIGGTAEDGFRPVVDSGEGF